MDRSTLSSKRSEAGQTRDVLGKDAASYSSPKIPPILPHERVYPIQISSELFKLSGASLSSDAPSYFSQYFKCQIERAEQRGDDISSAIKTLYIDRDPVTFRDIALHLQGYHITPRDGTHFVRLFADAQFYSLPRLMSQLYEESIFMSIGHREFQIPRDLFQDPGNSPNFFTLGFAIFYSNPDDVFPGLDRNGLIRPPSIIPSSVPNRSADTFADIIHLLRGYPVHIRDDVHRQNLLGDCRYYNFKGLEQRLIPHSISFNQTRRRDEISLRLEDILKSGISVVSEPVPGIDPLSGWVNYARPFVDNKPAELVLEIGGEATKIYLANMRAEFFRDAKARISRLFEVVATKLNLPPTTQPLGLLMAKGGASSEPPTPGNTPLSDDHVRVLLEPETAITLDGKPYTLPEVPVEDTHSVAALSAPSSAGGMDSPASLGGSMAFVPRKRRRVDSNLMGQGSEEWVVRKGQWRLRIQSNRHGKSAVECVLVAVKLDAMSSEHARNAQRGFLNA